MKVRFQTIRLPLIAAGVIIALAGAVIFASEAAITANAPSAPEGAPAIPTGLTASPGDGSVTLSWDNPGDSSITSYEYQVNHNNTSTGNLSGWGPRTTISGSGPDTTSHTFKGLANGKEYRFKLRAANALGASDPAPWAEPWYVVAMPRAAPAPTPPETPTGLTATPGDGSVTLSWNNPGDSSIRRYEYQVNHNNTSTGNLSGWGDWTAIPGSGAGATSHTFTGLPNGREYRYHLRAVNAAGAGVAAPDFGPPWYVSATPLAPDPTPEPTSEPPPEPRRRRSLRRRPRPRSSPSRKTGRALPPPTTIPTTTV